MSPTHVMPIVLLLAATAVAGAASAQPAAAPPAADTVSKAEALFQEGMRFVAQKQWADAEQRFLAAWALNPSYDVAANLGQTQYRLGKHREAARHLAYALKSWPLVGKRETRDLAEKRLAELRELLGSLTIRVTVPGAVVSVDGVRVGQSPVEVEVFVDPGSHVVEAKLDGYDDARAEVQAAKGAKQEVSLALARSAPPAVPVAGATPPRKEEQVPPLPPPVKQVWRPGVAVFVTGGVLAVGGLAAGVGLTVAANGKSSDADTIGARLGGPSTCTGTPATSVAMDCKAVKAALRSQSVLTDAAKGTFVAGGLLALATVGLAIWTSLGPTQKRVGPRLVPLVGARQGGFTVVGTW
jgi:hypothetical protein